MWICVQTVLWVRWEGTINCAQFLKRVSTEKTSVMVLEWEAFYILARRIFLKNILVDSAALKKRWPVDASEILTMYLIPENLVNVWDVIKDEFKKTKTLKDKHLLM